MSIKGTSYLKTTWEFEERPVASSKLNQWDDRIESALELAYFLLSRSWGGGDGVVRGATDDDLEVRSLEIPDMNVEVAPGYAFIDGHPYKLSVTLESGAIVKPTTDDRIDLVAADLESGGITVVTGSEAASPNAPSVPSDHIALAEIYLRPGMSIIKDVDDATNGFITDRRVFV